jgi:hypothetical protein
MVHVPTFPQTDEAIKQSWTYLRRFEVLESPPRQLSEPYLSYLEFNLRGAEQRNQQPS